MHSLPKRMTGSDHSSETDLAGDSTPRDESGGVDRLAAAMDVFLEASAIDSPERRECFLAEHRSLRDLLEPMFDRGDADDDAPEEATAIRPGLQIGDYHILREVGRGGMGTVFEAEQVSLRRQVALKVLHPHLSVSASSIERFRREAASAARLRHPAIVPIHEVGEWRGLHFFSMEFVVGRSLKQLAQSDRLGIRGSCSRAVERAELAARVADALEHAHGHSMVHRDVKPQNIMVGDDGVVRLLDFGLVKNLADESHSISGGFFGTPHYCSPEQASGQVITAPTADVFSLGIVLYELLARQRPFEGDTTRAVLDKVENGEFESLARAAPSAPKDLQTICHKALETDPDQRYQSAGAMAEDLRRFMRLEPIEARPRNLVSRGWKWTQRHRVRVALWSAAALVVAGVPTAYVLHIQGKSAAVAREREVVDRAEDLGFASINQTLTLISGQLERVPDVFGKAKQQVDALVEICNDYLKLRSQDPLRKQRVARAFYNASLIYQNLNQYDLAMAACERSQQIYENTPELRADYERYRARLIRRRLCLQQILHPEVADEEFEWATEHWLKELSTEGAEAAIEFATTLLIQSRSLVDRPSKYGDAEKLLLKIAKLLPEEVRQEGPAARVFLASRVTLGMVYLRTRRPRLALGELQSALAKLDELPVSVRIGIDQAMATSGVGQAQQLLGQSGAAEKSLRESIETAKQLLEEFPGSYRLRRAVMSSRLRLSILLLGKGEVDEAMGIAQVLDQPTTHGAAESVANGKTVWLDSYLRAQLNAQLASCLLMKSRGKGQALIDAREMFLRANTTFELLADERPEHFEVFVNLGASLNNLAAIANQNKLHADAAHYARRAIKAQRHVFDRLPEHRLARFYLGMHNSQLTLACGHLSDPGAVGAAFAATMSYAGHHAASLRVAAEGACVCANKLRESGDGDAATEAHAEECASLAVAALRKIASQSRAQATRWLNAKRFASLRDRDDFQQLAEELGQ